MPDNLDVHSTRPWTYLTLGEQLQDGQTENSGGPHLAGHSGARLIDDAVDLFNKVQEDLIVGILDTRSAATAREWQRNQAPKTAGQTASTERC
jgi:hypothetical protein